MICMNGPLTSSVHQSFVFWKSSSMYSLTNTSKKTQSMPLAFISWNAHAVLLLLVHTATTTSSFSKWIVQKLNFFLAFLSGMICPIWNLPLLHLLLIRLSYIHIKTKNLRKKTRIKCTLHIFHSIAFPLHVLFFIFRIFSFPILMRWLYEQDAADVMDCIGGGGGGSGAGWWLMHFLKLLFC